LKIKATTGGINEFEQGRKMQAYEENNGIDMGCCYLVMPVFTLLCPQAKIQKRNQ